MTTINSSMKKYIFDNSDLVSSFSVEEFVSKILNHTKVVFDCVLFCQIGEECTGRVNLDKIFQFYGDKTGYEAAVNDISIENENYNPGQLIELSRKLAEGLKKMYSNRKFCVIVNVDEHRTHVRFHTMRIDEPIWCDSDVEKYQEPVLLEIP